MEKRKISMIVGVVIGVVVLFYVGAMFDFFPFVADDLVIRALGFCTLIVCLVVTICSCMFLDFIGKNKE